MAQVLIWSREAIDDVDRLAEYISKDLVIHGKRLLESVERFNR